MFLHRFSPLTVVALVLTGLMATSPVSARPTPASLNPHQSLSGSIAARPPAQGKPPERVRADVAADITNFWPQMVAYQTNYRATNGLYFQGLYTHSQRPRNGVKSAPDLLDNHPTDQAQSWRAAWDGLGPREWRGRVDVYEGPNGAGWVLTVELELSDGVWAREWNEGPESWRSTDWVTVTP